MKIKLSLTTQIAAALALAIIAGVLLQGHPGFVNAYIKPFGIIFLNLLKFIVVPLVLFSIMAGILSMNDMSKLGKLGLRAVLYFAFTTVIAVSLGLVVSTLVRGWMPVIDLHFEGIGKEFDMPDITFMDQIINMFPDNILTPLSNMTMIQVIVIAIMFGIAIVHVAEKGEPVLWCSHRLASRWKAWLWLRASTASSTWVAPSCR
ncbi:MAG: cation:dicarboxylase symporter family transporter [Prevotella sp.]|nr:cation:dicarboxylase symporter family transporter [Prevotella sp.]